MIDIPHEALLFDLFYGGKGAGEESEADLAKRMKATIPPVTEETPSFRDIYITNIAATNVGRAMFFNGLPEMPIRNVHIKDVIINNAQKGIVISQGENVTIDNAQVETAGKTLDVKNSKNVKVNGQMYQGE